MKFVKDHEFIQSFHKKETPTFSVFYNNAKVRMGKKTESLKDYTKRKQIDKKIVQDLYNNIVNRDDYLQRFYDNSLLVKNKTIHREIKPMQKSELSNNQGIVYKNLIRNLHMLDILKNTSSGIENVLTYINVIDDLYNNHVIDYKLLTPSASHYISNGRIGSVFSSYYFRASIMNPYLVYSLNENVLKGTKIFTPTLGWSSYAYGFAESPRVTEYVGTDVIPNVCKKTKQLLNTYNHVKSTILCKPSEDLLKMTGFTNTYKDHFDLVFFSPPYYRLELYDSKNQSTTRYNSYNDWIEEYWRATIQLCHHVLAQGGTMCYILSGYGSHASNTFIDLVKDMNNVTASEGFKLKTKLNMDNKNVHVTKHRDTGENIMIYRKV